MSITRRLWWMGCAIYMLSCIPGCGRVGYDPLAPQSSQVSRGVPDGGSVLTSTQWPDGALGDAGAVGDAGRGVFSDFPEPVGRSCARGGATECAVFSEATAHIGADLLIGDGTVDGAAGLSGSCGGRDANEYLIAVNAQDAAVYEVAVRNPTFDVALYILDGGCGGRELACRAQPAGHDAELSLNLAAGQRVLVVVDGARGTCGDFDLQVSSPPP